MRTSSRVSFSTYQIWTCERTSSVEPYRFFRRRAPAATPRTRPDESPRKLTRRSASPRGNVFRMMASVSRAGMGSRRADAAPDHLQHSVRNARTRRAIVIITRALSAQCSREKILGEARWEPGRAKTARVGFQGVFHAERYKDSGSRQLREGIHSVN